MGDSQFCQSCTYPLSQSPEARGKDPRYCRMCTDDEGRLHPREEVRAGIAGWLAEWQGVDQAVGMARAEHFMKAMPAWADA